MKPALASLVALPLALGACVSQAQDVPTAPNGSSDGSSSNATANQTAWVEREGVFAPVEFSPIELWPEAYSGELLVLEVLPHGSIVAEGEVVATLDLRAIERQLRDAELELRSAGVQQEGLTQRNAIADEAAAASLAQARARLDRAKRSLEGYLERELEFTKRQQALQAEREKGFVDDQVDELDQLEKMYEADELVDATEDIVLKRSRRDLEATRAGVALSSARRDYENELTRPLQVEARGEEVRAQELALAHLASTQAIEARARTDAAQRAAVQLEDKRQRLQELQRDLELMTLTAPRAGVLLHGSLVDYRPSGKAPRLKRGSRLATRADVMLVAEPEHVAVALDVTEKELGRIENGARAKVSPHARPGATVSGRLDIESYPSQRGGGVFDARIELGSAPEVVFGMGAKVEIEASPEVEG